MYDYHLHSINSADGRLTVDEVCREMAKQNFREIAITDHLDYNCPGGGDSLLDYQKLSAEIKEARDRYQDQMNIALAIEIGLQPASLIKNQEFLKTHSFDFIIGSIHHVDGLEIFNGDYCRGKKREEAYSHYLEEVLRMVRDFSEFNVLGHLDVIRRFPGFENRRLETGEFSEFLEEILRTLAETGRGIEVNSSGYRYGLDDTLPSVSIVRRFRELGGEIVTVGSDAHRIGTYGYKIGESFRVLKEAGFQYLSVFRQGKPQQVKIP